MLLILSGLAILFASSSPFSVPTSAAPIRAPLPPRIFLPILFTPYNFQKTPKPLNLSVRLNPSRSVSGTISAAGMASHGGLSQESQAAVSAAMSISGGVISATAADGSIFTLTIPKDALITNTVIVITPLSAINGLPLGGRAGAGVQLYPEGIWFLHPLTLTIQTSARFPVTRELALAYHGNGQEFYQYPLALNTPTPTFLLSHFSGYAYLGDGISLPVTPSSPVPSDPEDQFKQAMAELFHQERISQLLGEPGDPQFQEELRSLMQAYYDQVVRPALLAAETNCDLAMNGATAKGFDFWRMAELYDGAAFAPQIREIQASMEIAYSHCWAVKTKPCLNWNDPQQLQEVLGLSRTAQLMGWNPDGFNFNTLPHCTCTGLQNVARWNLTLNASFQSSVEGVIGGGPGWATANMARSEALNVQLFLLGQTPDGTTIWSNSSIDKVNLFTGSSSVNDSATEYAGDASNYHFSSSTTGTTITTINNVGNYAHLTLHQASCTYDLDWYVPMQLTDVWGSYINQIFQPNLNVSVASNNAYTNPQAVALHGSRLLPVIWSADAPNTMGFGDGSASHYFLNILGNQIGTGLASWTLTPAP